MQNHIDRRFHADRRRYAYADHVPERRTEKRRRDDRRIGRRSGTETAERMKQIRRFLVRSAEKK